MRHIRRCQTAEFFQTDYRFSQFAALLPFLTELQLHILLISFKITVYSYIVAGIKSGTKIGINPNKISRFIFTKKDGKNNEKEKRERK